MSTWKELNDTISRERAFQIEWTATANAPRREMAGMCIDHKGD